MNSKFEKPEIIKMKRLLRHKLRLLLCALGIFTLFSAFKTLPAKDEKVVARFGHNTITLEEFNMAYMNILKQPKVFDSKKLREDFLNEMIMGKILSGEAKKFKLDDNEVFNYRVEAYRNKCLREKHFDAVIKPKINVSESDVEEAYQFTQEERRISHLFVNTKEKADSLFKLLNSGATFEELAKTVFADTSLANHGGDLGWVSWDQLDYDLAMTAFRLNVGFISKPIKSPFGYHIIKVTDFKKKPMITRQEYDIHRRKAKYLLEYKIGDKLANEMLENMIKKSKITVNSDVFKFVHDKLTEQIKRKPTQFDQMAEVQLHESEIKSLESSLWDMRHEEIATVNGKILTVGEFMGYLNFVPYQVIYNSFKNTSDYIFRDFMITQQAKEMGLKDPLKIDLKTRLYSDNLLSLAFRLKLVEGVSVKEDEIKGYYDHNNSDLKKVPFDQVHDYVKSLVLSAKKRDIVPEYVQKILNKMKVEKNLNLINDYYDSVLNNLN